MLIGLRKKSEILFKGKKKVEDIFVFSEKEKIFYYYKNPKIYWITPHCSQYNKTQEIKVLGEFFFNKPEINCVPYCFFGNKKIKAKYISNITLQCKSPLVKQSFINKFVPFKVDFNNSQFLKKKPAFIFYKFQFSYINNDFFFFLLI